MTQIRIFLAAMLLLVTACVPVYRNHGYVPPEEDLALVEIGQTSRAELPTLIGSPSSQGVLAGSSWFYVGSRWEHYGARPPREITRQVVAINFAEDDTVANVERFGLEEGRVVVLSRRVTDSSVTEISLIRQLIGNIGNFRGGSLIR